MAIINITSYTGRLYQYDDVAQQFIMNPDNDAGLNALTGWNNTTLTVAQLSAQHNGTTVFTGRPDYAGSAQKFPVMVLASGGTITNTTQVKVRVDRDPTIIQPLTTLSKEDMTDNLDGTHYIDIAYDVDKGYVYEQLAQTERWYFPSDGPFDTTYPQSISFTDADTGRSKTENYTITYTEASTELIIPKIISEATFTPQIFDGSSDKIYDAKNKTYSSITGTPVYSNPAHPTYTDNDIELHLGMPHNDPTGTRCVRMSAEGDGVWLDGSENLMRQGTSWSASFWFPPGNSGFRTVISKHGGATFSDWADINVENNTVYAYYGGTTVNVGVGSATYNNCVVISCEYISGTSYKFNAWLNGIQTITESTRTLANLRDLNRRVSLFARTADDTVGSLFVNSMVDKCITNIGLYDYAITATKADQIYRNQNNSIILGFSGDSNVGLAKLDYGYITKMIERYAVMGYPIRCYGINFSGYTAYEFGPTALVKAPWLSAYSQTRPDVTASISSDRLVGEYGCDVLIPAESSNFSLREFLYQEIDNGNASSGEYVYNIGQYATQAINAGIKLYPIGPLPVNSTALKRNVPWATVQYNCYSDAKAAYPKMIDTISWSTDAPNYLPKAEYVGDIQHFDPLFHSDFASGKLADTFDPIGLKLLDDLYPSLSTFEPIIIPQNIKDGDYVEFIAGDIIDFTYYVFNGDVLGNVEVTEQKALIAGENVVTLSFTDQWANSTSIDLNITYGPSLTAVIGDWAMDSIAPTTYIVTDSSGFNNDFEVFASNPTNKDTITVVGSKIVFPGSTVAKLLTVTDSTAWFPFAEEFGFMGWINPADVTTQQVIIGRGGNNKRRTFGIKDGQFYVNYTGSNDGTYQSLGPTILTGTRIHVACQLRSDAGATSNILHVWDIYINGSFHSSLDIDWFEEPVFQNCSFGGLSNNGTLDDFTSRLPLNATVDNWKYRNVNWTAQEISDIYTAEL